jgi:hypothetical protein
VSVLDQLARFAAAPDVFLSRLDEALVGEERVVNVMANSHNPVLVHLAATRASVTCRCKAEVDSRRCFDKQIRSIAPLFATSRLHLLTYANADYFKSISQREDRTCPVCGSMAVVLVRAVIEHRLPRLYAAVVAHVSAPARKDNGSSKEKAATPTKETDTNNNNNARKKQKKQKKQKQAKPPTDDVNPVPHVFTVAIPMSPDIVTADTAAVAVPLKPALKSIFIDLLSSDDEEEEEEEVVVVVSAPVHQEPKEVRPFGGFFCISLVSNFLTLTCRPRCRRSR